MEGRITVLGRGEAKAAPDRVSVRVAIEGEGATRDAAYAEAVRLAKAVDEVTVTYATDIAANATAALIVHPKSRWAGGEYVPSGWRAARSSTLEMVDFDRLADLLADLAAAGGALSGPYWELERSNAVHGEARRLAAADARQRAEDYAAALGLALGEVLWITEPGLTGGADRSSDVSYSIDAAAGTRSAAADVIDVTPDEMTVRAAVEVAFSIRS